MTTAISHAPEVGTCHVTFRLADPERALSAVRLHQEIARPRPGPDLEPGGTTWRLEWPRGEVDRLEYRFELVHRSGAVEVICDPSNPARAPGSFGEKSVVTWPGYSAPSWTQRSPEDPGELVPAAITAAALPTAIEALVWTSAGASPDRPRPLLVVHDGPEYALYSDLLRYLAILVEDGTIPPMRAALLPPVERDHTYSASAVYARSFGAGILPALLRAAPTPPGHRMRVGMGASLGALAMLHIHRAKPATFGGLFLQSGSYFRQRFDPQESSFVRFRRITRFVGKVLAAPRWAHPIAVTMTCGRGEENLHNNRAMRDSLRAQGYDLRWETVADAHNWIAWRDSFEPGLGRLLGDLWT